MRRTILTLLFLLLLAAPVFAQDVGYFIRADCGTLSPAAYNTVCEQSTTVSGRTAGTIYVFDGAAWVSATASSSGGHVIKDEGTSRTQRTNLNFVGTGVSCVDDSGNDETECTVPGVSGPDATYVTQTPDATLINEFALSTLSTGCLGVATTTGLLSSRTLTGGSQISIANGDCSGTPTFSIVANSLGPTQIDETLNFTWTGTHAFSGATVTGLGASSIVFTPNGSIAATNVQAAIQEVRDEAVGSGAPESATYITQTPNATLTNEQALSALSTGCLGVTTTTGVLASRTLTGGSQISIAGGDCSATPTFSIVANSIGPTQIDETLSFTWTGTHTFTGATVTGIHSAGINAQTGTTYTILDSDITKLVTFSNALQVDVTLPSAAGAGFNSGWYAHFKNLGAGEVIITATTSTIDGAASPITLVTNASCSIFSDGTNYNSFCSSSVTETQTLAQVAVLGRIVPTAVSKATAVRIGGATDTLQWCIYHDPTTGHHIEPCVDGNTRTLVAANFTWSLYDVEGDAAIATADPDIDGAGLGRLTFADGHRLHVGKRGISDVLTSASYDSTRTSISNSAAKTTLYTYVLPAGTMSANSCIEIPFLGQMQHAVAGNFTPYFAFGATEISNVTTALVPVAGSTVQGIFHVCNRGATNSQFMAYRLSGSADLKVMSGNGTAAIDTTGAVTITISGQYSVADATNNIHQDIAYVRRSQ